MNAIFVWTFREEESQLKEEISVKELFLQKEKEIFVLRYNITRITSVYLYLSLLNPLHPNISWHSLHTVHLTFSKMLPKRICFTIHSFVSWWSFSLFSWSLCVICKEKLDASHT